MRKASFDNIDFAGGCEQVNVKPQQGCVRWSRSRNSLMADAAEAGAIIRIGRSVLISVPIMDKYYSSLAGE